ncbi:hypothetical protein D8674_038719 [Pyrus ussuriensis x Pyrus communis]|uniref:Uncharacterized protein n=1 Tax=Pyrus ussuriensis x Pyrus communis TaxID=2448454 RepID=A0A5N5HV74_9ROSA|nr:hypothetical protein D8674_038719 [Pyrus ussuriensis x Pyrus communis]
MAADLTPTLVDEEVEIIAGTSPLDIQSISEEEVLRKMVEDKSRVGEKGEDGERMNALAAVRPTKRKGDAMAEGARSSKMDSDNN